MPDVKPTLGYGVSKRIDSAITPEKLPRSPEKESFLA